MSKKRAAKDQGIVFETPLSQRDPDAMLADLYIYDMTDDEIHRLATALSKDFEALKIRRDLAKRLVEARGQYKPK